MTRLVDSLILLGSTSTGRRLMVNVPSRFTSSVQVRLTWEIIRMKCLLVKVSDEGSIDFVEMRG